MSFFHCFDKLSFIIVGNKNIIFTFVITNEENILTYYLESSKTCCPTTTKLINCLILKTVRFIKSLTVNAVSQLTLTFHPYYILL